MFLNKVGSDACLVLDATFDSGTFTIAQTFTLNDLIKASKTKCICVRGDTGSGFIIGICSFIDYDNGGFSVFGCVSNSLIEIAFTESGGVWTGTIVS